MDTGFLIPLFSIIAVTVFYPVLIVYVALVAGAGVFSWFIAATMLSPIVALWYIVVRKRMLSELKVLLDNKPHAWNISETLAEYEELLKKKPKN